MMKFYKGSQCRCSEASWVDSTHEDPVAGGRESHALAASAKWEDLCGDQPWHGAPCEAVDDVVQHHKGVLAVGFDCDGHFRLVESADDGKKDSHQHSTKQEQWLSTPFISQPPGDNGGCGVRNGVCGGV
jgi:hypothetical protein